VINCLKKFVRNTSGASSVEYAIIATVISVAALGGYMALGQQSNETMKNVASKYAEVQ